MVSVSDTKKGEKAAPAVGIGRDESACSYGGWGRFLEKVESLRKKSFFQWKYSINATGVFTSDSGVYRNGTGVYINSTAVYSFFRTSVFFSLRDGRMLPVLSDMYVMWAGRCWCSRNSVGIIQVSGVHWF